VLAYGCYLAANRIGVSGALSVVAAGMVFGKVGRDVGLSDDSQRFLGDLWGYIGFLANTGLFVLIGLETNLGALAHNATWIIVAVLAALLIRAIMVYGLALGIRSISLAYGHILFWGGLRGGIAIAVALSIPNSVPGRELILALTFGVVLFTIVVQGRTIEPLAKRLRLIGQ
jgi:CPA1 family monovalent cation:H+ antiporter